MRLKNRITSLQIDRTWAQIKIIQFQNKLKGIEKIIEDMKEKCKLQLQRKGERTQNKDKRENHFRNEYKIRRSWIPKLREMKSKKEEII